MNDRVSKVRYLLCKYQYSALRTCQNGMGTIQSTEETHFLVRDYSTVGEHMRDMAVWRTLTSKGLPSLHSHVFKN